MVCALLAAGNGAAQDRMTMEDCVGYAFEHSRELARLKLVYEGQLLTTGIHRGKFRPTLNASTNHTLDAEHTRGSATVSKEFPAGVNLGLRRRKQMNEVPVKRVQRWPRLTLSATTSKASDDGMNLSGDADTSLGLALSWEIGARTQRTEFAKLMNDIDIRDIAIEDTRQDKARQIRDL